MNTIFIKEVSNTVMNGKNVKLDVSKVGNENYILEMSLNISKINDISKYINGIKKENVIHNKPTLISTISNFKNKHNINKLKKNMEKLIKNNNLIGYSVVFSNTLKKKKDIKDYIKEILQQFSINEYLFFSTVENNLDKYIEEYKLNNNLKNEDITPAILANDVNNINLNIIKDLNNKYKELVIFSLDKVGKKFQNKIKEINDEYGSCIQILNRSTKDFKRYNICIFIDKSRIEYSKFRFSKNTCFVDFTNKENDKFNEKYLKLEKGMQDQIYYISKIKELYELYGKITVSNAIID